MNLTRRLPHEDEVKRETSYRGFKFFDDVNENEEFDWSTVDGSRLQKEILF